MLGDLITGREGAADEIGTAWLVADAGVNWFTVSTGSVMLAYRYNDDVAIKLGLSQNLRTADVKSVISRVFKGVRNNLTQTPVKVGVDALSNWLGGYVPPTKKPCPTCIDGSVLCPVCQGRKGHICKCHDCGCEHVVICPECSGKGKLSVCTECAGVGHTFEYVQRPVNMLGLAVDANLVARLLFAIDSDRVFERHGVLTVAKGADRSHFAQALIFQADGLLGLVTGMQDVDLKTLPLWEPDKIGLGNTMSKLDLDD